MNEVDAAHLLKTIQSIDDEVVGLDDAIAYALEVVPKIDYDTWYGTIYNNIGEACGVFRANGYESRWFPKLDQRAVAHILAEEML